MECLTCLEKHKEESEESVDNVVLRRPRHFGIPNRHLRQIGTFC